MTFGETCMSLASQRSPSPSSGPGAHIRLPCLTHSILLTAGINRSLPLVLKLFQDAHDKGSQEETLACSLTCLGAPSPAGSPEGMSSGQGRSQSPVAPLQRDPAWPDPQTRRRPGISHCGLVQKYSGASLAFVVFGATDQGHGCEVIGPSISECP